MIGFSHLILHVVLCKSPARSGALPINLRVVMAYRIAQPEMNQTFQVSPDDAGEAAVEFDAMQGVYLMKVRQSGGCGADQFVTVLSEHPRELSVQLGRPPPPAQTSALVAGAAPPGYSYVRPTIVYFAKPAACDAPIGTPLTDGITVLNDLDAYYATVRPPAVLIDPKAYLVALRLRTATGGFHYVKVPVDFPPSEQNWPTYQKMDVNENIIDFVAGKPFDTLLCPRISKTSV
ncbi:MAG: hypothetical protein ABI182_08455 [Candidatus Baltobacteraceae bacterium]